MKNKKKGVLRVARAYAKRKVRLGQKKVLLKGIEENLDILQKELSAIPKLADASVDLVQEIRDAIEKVTVKNEEALNFIAEKLDNISELASELSFEINFGVFDKIKEKVKEGK